MSLKKTIRNYIYVNPQILNCYMVTLNSWYHYWWYNIGIKYVTNGKKSCNITIEIPLYLNTIHKIFFFLLKKIKKHSFEYTLVSQIIVSCVLNLGNSKYLVRCHQSCIFYIYFRSIAAAAYKETAPVSRTNELQHVRIDGE